LEHLCSWHNLPFASEANGFGGLSARLIFNQESEIFHISKVVEWKEKNVFTYAGRFNNEPEKLFTEQKCAILLQGANRLPILEKQANFPIGVGFLPYWPQMVKEPYNLNIGGASFWVMSGFSENEYRGIVQFFEYLSSPEIQAYWHQKTGYLPITDAAYYLTKKKGFYKNHPAAEIAVLSVMGNTSTQYTKGIRLGNYVQIRDVIIDHLEKAINGEMTPKEALDNAVEKGNQMLETFESGHSLSS
jgi:sn-glycerol 3-phosphate transport system substrate-binding protein